MGVSQYEKCSPSSGGRLWRVMRKLKSESNKMLCMAARPATIECQYDPQSYALNFDHNGFEDDDDDVPYRQTFSYRFAAATTPRSLLTTH